MQNTKTPTVVCAADNNYAIPLGVMLYSLAENLKEGKAFIYVIDGGITNANKKKVIRSLQKLEVEVVLNWLKPQEAAFFTIVEKLPTWGHVTIAAYYRLLIPYLLPPSIEKVIYLDCDLILKEDLNNLWKIDIDNQYLFAVQDMGCPLVSSKNGLKTYQELQIPPDTPYFNSGVMILNLKKWREDDMSFKVINYLEENGRRLRYWDQDGLNAILAGCWGKLDPRWNQLPNKFSSWQESHFSEEVYHQVMEAPYLIHFASDDKPWKFKFSPLRDTEKQFFEYLDRTDWSGWRPKEAWKKRLERYFNKALAYFKTKSVSSNIF
ncbi:glycosyl transferase family 8 [Microcystis aeruginosa NIES-3806]|uniref:glycosyltransferase family 8 protein n=1 Tax=Microcystis aeruginosa TaxID=1126 RepID=UPI0013068244|nr:glycosyltransferase family 8 protein [Microcystis aeruginosa]GCL53457.1 glycosyl transferase family 8 [Microcystis aeruginosa NIES-3806]